MIISIMGFRLFDCPEYHSEYQALEVTRHTPLSDRMVLHYYELPNLPETVKADNNLEIWLSLFKAKTEEELADLEALEAPEMREAITAYRHITVTPEFQEVERLRSKARHDEAQALWNERRKEKFDVARNAVQMNLATDDIIKLTGLTREEVENLNNAN